jgi:hypothetical protein
MPKKQTNFAPKPKGPPIRPKQKRLSPTEERQLMRGQEITGDRRLALALNVSGERQLLVIKGQNDRSKQVTNWRNGARSIQDLGRTLTHKPRVNQNQKG